MSSHCNHVAIRRANILRAQAEVNPKRDEVSIQKNAVFNLGENKVDYELFVTTTSVFILLKICSGN